MSEEEFIAKVKEIKDTNKKLAMEAYKMRGERISSDLSQVKDVEEYSRRALYVKASESILRKILAGVLASIDPSEMTEDQNKYFNAWTIVLKKDGYSLEKRQEMVKSGLFTYGFAGDFASFGIFDGKPQAKEVWNKESWFYKTFYGQHQGLIEGNMIAQILGVDESKAWDTLHSFEKGQFPAELSSEGKAMLFDLLADPNVNHAYVPVDEEIMASHKSR